MPDPGRVINYNRFLYTRGNPLKYKDPSGHCGIGSNDDGDAIITKFDCTVEDFQNLSWEERLTWVRLIVDQEKLDEWLDDITAAIKHLSSDPDFQKMSGWAAQMDAGILQAINDGVRLHRGQEPVGGDITVKGETVHTHGGEYWRKFLDFEAKKTYKTDTNALHEAIRTRYAAEQQGVNYSRNLPETRQRVQNAGLGEQAKIVLFLLGADAYRATGFVCHMFTACVNPYTDPRTAVDETFVGGLAEWPEALTRPIRDLADYFIPY